MTRLVMDILFAEELEFPMSAAEYTHCMVQPSREEGLRACLVTKGLELMEYGSFRVIPVGLAAVKVEVFSRAYRSRAERAAGH